MGPGAGAAWHLGGTVWRGGGFAPAAKGAVIYCTHIDRLWSRHQRHLEIKRELVRAELRVEEAQEVLDLRVWVFGIRYTVYGKSS